MGPLTTVFIQEIICYFITFLGIFVIRKWTTVFVE